MRHTQGGGLRRVAMAGLTALVLGLLVFTARFASVAQTTRAPQAATPAAMLLVLNKTDNNMAIVDPASMQVIGRVPTGEGPHEVAVSADGRFAYVANYGTQQVVGSSISVIDLRERREVRRADISPLGRPHGIVEAGGKIYFTAETNRAIARYDPATNRVDWIMGTGQNGTHMLVVSADGRRIYTSNLGSASVTAIEFNATNPNQTRVTHITVGAQPEGIDLSPDGRELWVGHNGDGQISIIDTSTNTVRETIRAGEVPIRVRFTPDGRRVLVSDPKRTNPENGEVIIFDAATRRELRRLQIGNVPIGVVVSPDSRRAFVATSQANSVRVINLEDMSLAGSVETGRTPDGMIWVGR